MFWLFDHSSKRKTDNILSILDFRSRIEKTIFRICAFSRELCRLIAFYSVSSTTMWQNFQTNVKQYKSKCKLRSQSNQQEKISVDTNVQFKARHLATKTSYCGRRLVHLRCVTISFNKLSKSKPLQPQLSSSCQGDKWLRGLSNDCIWRARQLAGLGGCLVKVSKVVWGFSFVIFLGRQQQKKSMKSAKLKALRSHWGCLSHKLKGAALVTGICAGGTTWCSLQTPR